MTQPFETAVITTPERTDRHVLFAQFAAGAGVKYRWHTTDPVAAPAGHRASQQAYNCARSHGMLLAEADSDLLVLEDDAALPPSFLQDFAATVDGLPHTWQILKLGGQHAFMPYRVKTGLVLCEHTIRTHAYFVRGEARAELSKLALTTTGHWDAEYAALDRNGHSYAPDPFLVPVYESRSDIPDFTSLEGISVTTPTLSAKISAAIAQVYANANPAWKDIAYRAVVYVARTNRVFTSDDVWDALGLWYPHVTTHEHRAMGPVLRNATRDGICKINDCTTCGTRKVVVQSRRPQANGMDTPVYRSLIFGIPAIKATQQPGN